MMKGVPFQNMRIIWKGNKLGKVPKNWQSSKVIKKTRNSGAATAGRNAFNPGTPFVQSGCPLSILDGGFHQKSQVFSAWNNLKLLPQRDMRGKPLFQMSDKIIRKRHAGGYDITLA